jgi:predicted nuclease of predicted toxin-antitoxin system
VIFLVDAQLPPALARWLTQQGHVAQHVDDLGLRNAEDLTIWNHASNSGAIIITKDEDFAERTTRDTSAPVIVWLRIGNATNQALMQWLTPRWEEITMLLDPGVNRLIEVR